MPKVDWPDLEEWLCDYVRGILAAEALAADVGNKELEPVLVPTVVIRDDGGQKTSVITATRAVGFTILAGTRRNDGPAKDLGRVLLRAVTDEDLPVLGGRSCPITSVVEFNGWYTVPESQDVTRLYFTVTYTVAGSPFG